MSCDVTAIKGDVYMVLGTFDSNKTEQVLSHSWKLSGKGLSQYLSFSEAFVRNVRKYLTIQSALDVVGKY